MCVKNPCLPNNKMNESPPTKGGVTKCKIGINEKNLLNGMFAFTMA